MSNGIRDWHRARRSELILNQFRTLLRDKVLNMKPADWLTPSEFGEGFAQFKEYINGGTNGKTTKTEIS